MSLPKPPFELDGHCSTIHNDILYVLASDGFVSLPLKRNEKAQWTKEKNGQKVTGPSCVKVAPNGDESNASLFVVGGTSSNSDYGGLQRYIFASKSWEIIPTAVNVFGDRTNHSVAYIEDSQNILVYAGSQPDAPSVLSSQTFAISTQQPFGVQAFTSTAPPVHLPILTTWNTSHAIMAGGTQNGVGVYTWGPLSGDSQFGWSKFPTALPHPISSSSRGLIVDGADGSKVLQLYDFSTSPNQVTSVVLEDTNGRPAPNGQIVGNAKSSSLNHRRALSLTNWPAYNSSDAPTAIRSDCSVADSDDGLSVMAGGNDRMPIALFNRFENSWVDVDDFFGPKQQQPLLPSVTTATTTTTPTATSSPTHTTSAATPSHTAAPATAAHDRTLRTLGITLGVLCGIAALFVIILLWLRWRKLKQRQKTGYIEEKRGDRMDFADRGASFMKEAGGSVNELALPPRNRYDSMGGGSRSSLAIIAGKFGRRATDSHAHKNSCESTARLVKDKSGNPVLVEPFEMVDMEKKLPVINPQQASEGLNALPTAEKEIKQGRKRSSGWSKYFATNQPGAHLSHIPSVYIKPQHQMDESHYSGQLSVTSRFPSSALVPPSDIGSDKLIDGQRLSHVNMSSPHFANSHEDLARRGSLPGQGQAGQIVDADTRKSTVSGLTLSSYDGGDRSTLNSAMTDDFFAEHRDLWTPVGAGSTFKDHLNQRPPSSGTVTSVYEPNLAEKVPSRGRTPGFFPGAGTTYRPTSRHRPSTAGSGAASTAKASVQSSVVTNGLTFPLPAETRASTMTVFPAPSSYESPAKARTAQSKDFQPITTDVSWVNLSAK